MIVTAGKTNVSVYYYIVQDASGTSPGEPVTGLLFSDIETGGSASYVRQGAARTDLTLITLASASAAHADGGFILVDDTNQPGLYRCDYPDAAFVTGVDQVFLSIVVASGKNAVAAPIKVEITDVDFRDSTRAGILALPNANADAAGGLPISDAGGLDLDAMNTNINDIETDTADMQPRVVAIEVDTNSLNDTKIPNTLNTTALGNIGIDWANVENEGSTVDLSATDIQLVDTTTTNTDMRGTNSAALASVATEARLAELDAGNLPSDVDAIKAKTDSLTFTSANKIDSNVLEINSVVKSAQVLERWMNSGHLTIVQASPAPTTTSFKVDFTEPNTNQLKGNTISFPPGVDSLDGANAVITASTTAGVITFAPALPVAPKDGDAVVLIPLAPDGSSSGLTDWTATEKENIRQALGVDGTKTSGGAAGDLQNILTDTGTTIPATITTLQIDVTSILLDTGTTIPGTITTMQTDVTAILLDTGTTIPGTITTLQTDVTSILLDTGTTIPGTITTLQTDVTAIKDRTDKLPIKKNVAIANFYFVMFDTDGDAVPGIAATISAQVSKDGGAIGPIAGTVVEVGSGIYKLPLTAGETNFKEGMYVFSDPSAATTFKEVITESV